MIKKKNETFWVKIDTKEEILGDESSFVMYYIDDSSGVSSAKFQTFEEIKREISGKYVEVDGDLTEGSDEIPFSDCSLLKRDSFSDGIGNHYFVVDRLNTSLKIKPSLKTNISNGTKMNESDSTGLYKSPMKFTAVGNYTIKVYHTKSNFSSSFSINIVEENLTDVNKKLDSAIAAQSKKTISFV